MRTHMLTRRSPDGGALARTMRALADPFIDLRSGVEHIARDTDQSPRQAALGLATLIEGGHVLVDGLQGAIAVRRLRDLAATYGL